MTVHLYTGSLGLVKKSGVGQAVLHQKAMLESAQVRVTQDWSEKADAVHINTVLPDSVLAALRAKARGEKVVYYGHSTMQDFAIPLWAPICWPLSSAGGSAFATAWGM